MKIKRLRFQQASASHFNRENVPASAAAVYIAALFRLNFRHLGLFSAASKLSLMMGFPSGRLLPARGEFPYPGKDSSGTSWQNGMKTGEVALFYFDAQTLEPRKADGAPPDTPITEYCLVYGSLSRACQIAAGAVVLHSQILCAIYAKSGKWLETRTREGVRRRNEGVGLILLLFRGALLPALATLILIFGSQRLANRLGTESIRWGELTPQEKVGVIWLGASAAIIAWYIAASVRNRILIWQARPALAPIGSPLREKLYKALAKNKGRNLLVPTEITLQEAVIEWPDHHKYELWSRALRDEGFEPA